jgi:integrase
MNRHATNSNQATTKRPVHTAKFAKVQDGRKQDIRGLWVRNGRYYAQLQFEDAATGQKKVRRVPLVDPETKTAVTTTAQAVEQMNRLKVKRSESDLPVLNRTPKFKAFAKTYLDFIQAGEGIKKPKTIRKEKYALDGWITHLGERRIDKINRSHVNAYLTKRLNERVSPRTVNLDVIALNAVLKHAIDEKWIKVLPTQNMRPLKCAKPKRQLFTSDDLERLCAAAMAKRKDGSGVTKNGRQFCDYIRLLAYCGAREQEALALRWQDVDFKRGQLTIGATGDTKNSTGRTVDFNPKLRAHLEDMEERRVQDSDWLFPSPQRGEKDIHAQTFRESLKLVRAHAAQDKPAMADKAFHDLRHHFISYCVMSGIDYMTIAEWVGHRDGGVLIGKVYGHLADSHKREQAQKLNFGPAVLPDAASV